MGETAFVISTATAAGGGVKFGGLFWALVLIAAIGFVAAVAGGTALVVASAISAVIWTFWVAVNAAA